MADNSYAQLIDDFDAGIQVLEGETLTEYIKRMGGVDYNAHGGSVGIEVLFNPKRDKFAEGGWNPGVGRDTRGYQTTSPHHSGGGGGPPSILNPPANVIKKKPPVQIPTSDNSGFLSNVRLKNQQKYFDLLNKYKPDDFNIRNQIDGTSNLTEEESNFMERYGIGKIYEDLSKQNIENFMNIREGVAPKVDPLQITSPKKYEFAEVTDIDLKRAKEPMTKMMDYDTYKSINPGSKISPYEFDELKKGNITETGTFTAADGGRVGFVNGGWADGLEGEALSIYNSMNAYGASDAEIQSKLQGQNLWSPTNTTTDTGQVTGIINQDIGEDPNSSLMPIGSGSGQGSGLIGDFMSSTQERQNRLTNPNKVQSLINNFTGSGQPDIGGMIRSGEVDTRKLAGLPFAGNILSKMLPDNYYNMSLGDQVFTQSQMGYDGPTVFGENTMGNKDPFGLNVRSGLGNYSEAVGKDFSKLSDHLGSKTLNDDGGAWNEELGMFEGPNAAYLNQMNKMNITRWNFRKQQLGVKNRLDSMIKIEEQKKAAAQTTAQQLKEDRKAGAFKDTVQLDPGTGGGGSQGSWHGQTEAKERQGQQVAGPGFGEGAYFDEGGLATMFTRRR